MAWRPFQKERNKERKINKQTKKQKKKDQAIKREMSEGKQRNYRTEQKKGKYGGRKRNKFGLDLIFIYVTTLPIL